MRRTGVTTTTLQYDLEQVLRAGATDRWGTPP